MIPELFPGDIILSRSNGLMSKIIRWFGKLRSGDCRFSHAALVISSSMIVESLWKVRINSVEKYAGQEIIIYRMNNLTDLQRVNIALRASSVAGDAYGVAKIPLFALDSVFRTYFFTKTFGLTSFKVCSNLIGWAFQKEIDKDIFGVDWRCLSPDGIDDWCDSRPNFWQEIYRNL